MTEEEDIIFEVYAQRWASIREEEHHRVRILGDRIGYGRMRQLAEQIWREKLTPQRLQGGEHSVGCCAAFLVKCPCPEDGRDVNGHCDWCCGSGRVTKKVFEVMTKQEV